MASGDSKRATAAPAPCSRSAYARLSGADVVGSAVPCAITKRAATVGRGQRLARGKPRRETADADDPRVVGDGEGGPPAHRVSEQRDRCARKLRADPVESPAGVGDRIGNDASGFQPRNPKAQQIDRVSRWPVQSQRQVEVEHPKVGGLRAEVGIRPCSRPPCRTSTARRRRALPPRRCGASVADMGSMMTDSTRQLGSDGWWMHRLPSPPAAQ